jgi:putative effector of murein hydrolase LrgA (UPF0299 family)
MTGPIRKFFERPLPNNIVRMTTSESELRYCYFLLTFIPFLSAMIGMGLTFVGDNWVAWVMKILALCAYSFMLVVYARSVFTQWRVKEDLMR